MRLSKDVLAAGKEPDGDRTDNREEAEDKADIANELELGGFHGMRGIEGLCAPKLKAPFIVLRINSLASPPTSYLPLGLEVRSVSEESKRSSFSEADI